MDLISVLIVASLAVLLYISASRMFSSAKTKEQGLIDDINANLRVSIQTNTISKKLDTVAKFNGVEDPKALLTKANDLLALA